MVSLDLTGELVKWLPKTLKAPNGDTFSVVWYDAMERVENPAPIYGTIAPLSSLPASRTFQEHAYDEVSDSLLEALTMPTRTGEISENPFLQVTERHILAITSVQAVVYNAEHFVADPDPLSDFEADLPPSVTGVIAYEDGITPLLLKADVAGTYLEDTGKTEEIINPDGTTSVVRYWFVHFGTDVWVTDGTTTLKTLPTSTYTSTSTPGYGTRDAIEFTDPFHYPKPGTTVNVDYTYRMLRPKARTYEDVTVRFALVVRDATGTIPYPKGRLAAMLADNLLDHFRVNRGYGVDAGNTLRLGPYQPIGAPGPMDGESAAVIFIDARFLRHHDVNRADVRTIGRKDVTQGNL